MHFERLLCSSVTTVFHEMPMPAILSSNLYAVRESKMQSYIEELESKVKALTARLEIEGGRQAEHTGR